MAYASVMIFGFSGESQLEQVAGDHGRWSGEKRDVLLQAQLLATEVQERGYTVGAARRYQKCEYCLVALPVHEIEKASGRSGLSVVMGVAASPHSRISDWRLYPQMMQHLEATIIATFDDQREVDLTQSLELLTQSLQSTDSGAIREHLGRGVDAQSSVFTFLVEGYTRASPARWHAKPTRSSPVIMASMLTRQLHLTRRNQLGYAFPVAAFAHHAGPRGAITEHHFDNGVLYTSQATELLASKPSRRIIDLWQRVRAVH